MNQYRRAYGEYPESLEELRPEFLSDLPPEPFCNAPFRYRNEGATYVLYGCGFDGDDDGGIVNPTDPRKINEPAGDDFYSLPRGENRTYEPELRPVEPEGARRNARPLPRPERNRAALHLRRSRRVKPLDFERHPASLPSVEA